MNHKWIKASSTMQYVYQSNVIKTVVKIWFLFRLSMGGILHPKSIAKGTSHQQSEIYRGIFRG